MISYPLIASEILNKLFSEPKRSTELTKDLGYSSKLIYQTIKDLEDENLITTQTDRPKFKVYQITDEGRSIALDEKIKSQSGLLSELKKSELNEVFEQFFGYITTKTHPKSIVDQYRKIIERSIITTTDWHNAILLTTVTGAHSGRAKQLMDSIDNEPSDTLAPKLENLASAT